MQRNQSAFAVASHDHIAGRRQGTDARDDLLHFITNDVPPHFVRLPVNPFAMRLVRETFEPLVAGEMNRRDW